MPEWSVILEVLNTAALVLGGLFFALFKKGAETAVKTKVEEGIKAALREAEWPNTLARALEKRRGLERQELRFKGYGVLWKELRPLAIYDHTKINAKTAGGLYAKLTEWYFSECGGLLLTPQSRDFYFALQDLLRIITTLGEDWDADRSEKLEGDTQTIFSKVLRNKEASDAIKVLEYFSDASFEDWQSQAIGLGKKWRAAVKDLGKEWTSLDERQRFATLQQVGSKLRTSLINDLETRER